MPSSPLGRRHAISLIALGLAMPVLVCSPAVRKYIVLGVVKYSYMDRVITNIMFNDTDFGVMNRYGSTGTIVGVGIHFGAQTLQWTLGGPEGTPRNGVVVTPKNQLAIRRNRYPQEHVISVYRFTQMIQLSLPLRTLSLSVPPEAGKFLQTGRNNRRLLYAENKDKKL